MTPEEIRRLYASERAATDAEAAEYRAEALTDPKQACRFLAAIAALASADPAMATLMSSFMGAALMLLIEERAAADDAFALRCAALAFQMMDQLARTGPPAPKTPRGKATKVRTA